MRTRQNTSRQLYPARPCCRFIREREFGREWCSMNSAGLRAVQATQRPAQKLVSRSCRSISLNLMTVRPERRTSDRKRHSELVTLTANRLIRSYAPKLHRSEPKTSQLLHSASSRRPGPLHQKPHTLLAALWRELLALMRTRCATATSETQ